MRSVPTILQTKRTAGLTTEAYALLLARADGTLFGFTSHDAPLTLDITSWGYTGVTAMVFDPAQGMDVSSLVSTSGLNVDNLEINTGNDGSLFTTSDVRAGRWRGCKWRIFAYDWSYALTNTATVVDHTETVAAGTLGGVTMDEVNVKVELRSQKQLLQQAVGNVASPICPARLGDANCTKDITTFTHTGTVTSVVDRAKFSDSAIAQADGYFNYGVLTWTSGLNDGLSIKVQAFVSNEFSLSLPMFRNVQVGDTFTAIAGCDGLLTTCRDKFNNVLNFQGYPHTAGVDAITAAP